MGGGVLPFGNFLMAKCLRGNRHGKVQGPPKGSVCAYVAQSVEHFLGKEEVAGSIPFVGSIS